MLSDERIEQLELEVKVLRANNKGLKDKIDEQSKEIEELKDMNERQQYRIELVSEDEIEERGDSIDESTMLKQIKAKIEELQKEKEFYNKDENREWGQYNNWDWVDTIINEMQSLLEKE